MINDRYKLIVYDIVKIPHDNIHIAHKPHKRYAIWDKLMLHYLSEPHMERTTGYSRIIQELRWLNSMENRDFELYDKEVLSYCFSIEK